MFRRSLLAAFAATVLLFLVPETAEARVISHGNPHQFSSIHGINYSSMRWERQQGNRRSLVGRSYRRSWRRR